VSKRRGVFIGVLVAVMVPVLLLTVGGVATAMADESAPPPVAVEGNGLLARVAQILEIPEDDLIGAFQQARQEMRGEACLRSLDKALENERITQEEYDAILEWREQRPDVMDCPIPHALGAPAVGNKHMWNNHNAWSSHNAWGGSRAPRLAE